MRAEVGGSSGLTFFLRGLLLRRCYARGRDHLCLARGRGGGGGGGGGGDRSAGSLERLGPNSVLALVRFLIHELGRRCLVFLLREGARERRREGVCARGSV